MSTLLAAACEPLALPPLSGVHVEPVARSVAQGPVARFAHFHDACEFVLFEAASGTLYAQGGERGLGASSLVIVPSMMSHDFALDAGESRWTLAQVAPWLVEAAGGGRGGGALVCTTLGPVAFDRARMLLNWLRSAIEPGETLAILTLFLSLARTDAATPEALIAQPRRGGASARLRIVLDRLHARPGDPLSSAEAASLASLSPAYFSRTFARVMGQGFSDYVAAYRLQVGAHLLLTTPLPVASIAFRAGFASPSHFTARFRHRFALTPKEYRATRDARAPTVGD